MRMRSFRDVSVIIKIIKIIIIIIITTTTTSVGGLAERKS